MRFATSRFYPVNLDNKVLYLDSQPRKIDCEKFPNCTGISGSQIKAQWSEMQKQGFTTKRMKPEPRGGAGRGQGRPKTRSETQPPPVPLRTTVQALNKLREYTENLRVRSGKTVTLQAQATSLILRADWRKVINQVQSMKSQQPDLVVIEAEADAYLAKLVSQIKPLKPDVRVGKGNVFAAIVEVSLGAKV
jgi:hypothetical protein